MAGKLVSYLTAVEDDRLCYVYGEHARLALVDISRIDGLIIEPNDILPVINRRTILVHTQSRARWYDSCGEYCA